VLGVPWSLVLAALPTVVMVWLLYAEIRSQSPSRKFEQLRPLIDEAARWLTFADEVSWQIDSDLHLAMVKDLLELDVRLSRLGISKLPHAENPALFTSARLHYLQHLSALASVGDVRSARKLGKEVQ